MIVRKVSKIQCMNIPKSVWNLYFANPHIVDIILLNYQISLLVILIEFYFLHNFHGQIVEHKSQSNKEKCLK